MTTCQEDKTYPANSPRGDSSGLPDDEILQRFVCVRDEAAFALLVCRHGPMVLSVCRRVLGNHADAEDAFQATFLVLAAKAGSIHPPCMVGNWLYGVAQRTASAARRSACKQRLKEANAMPRIDSSQDVKPEVLAGLDEELAALPEKYRAAVVLCDLEGESYKDAAKALGCPEGTVASRVSRGRKLLAARLIRRGLVCSAGAVAAVLSQGTASAHVPEPLLTVTVKSAANIAAGNSATVSTSVAFLMKGALKTMALSKMQIGGGATLVVLLALGAGGFACWNFLNGRDPAADTSPVERTQVITVQPNDDHYRLQKGTGNSTGGTQVIVAPGGGAAARSPPMTAEEQKKHAENALKGGK